MDFWLHLFPIIGFVGYFLSALGYLSQLLDRPYVREQTARRMLIVGFLGHFSFLALDSLGRFVRGRGLFFDALVLPSFPLTLSLIACISVGIFLLFERRLGISLLGAFLAPLAMLLTLLSAVLFHLDRAGLQPFENSGLLWLHIGLTILGHVAFLLAFGVSAALIVQESLLKNRRFSALQRKLPSLTMLDRLNAQLLTGGFLLMSSGVLLGFVFGWQESLDLLPFSSRVLWSCITLGIYACLLLAITMKGLRGRRAAWLSVIGFCTVVGSFVSANVVGSGFHVH